MLLFSYKYRILKAPILFTFIKKALSLFLPQIRIDKKLRKSSGYLWKSSVIIGRLRIDSWAIHGVLIFPFSTPDFRCFKEKSSGESGVEIAEFRWHNEPESRNQSKCCKIPLHCSLWLRCTSRGRFKLQKGLHSWGKHRGFGQRLVESSISSNWRGGINSQQLCGPTSNSRSWRVSQFNKLFLVQG